MGALRACRVAALVVCLASEGDCFVPHIKVAFGSPRSGAVRALQVGLKHPQAGCCSWTARRRCLTLRVRGHATHPSSWSGRQRRLGSGRGVPARGPSFSHAPYPPMYPQMSARGTTLPNPWATRAAPAHPTPPPPSPSAYPAPAEAPPAVLVPLDAHALRHVAEEDLLRLPLLAKAEQLRRAVVRGAYEMRVQACVQALACGPCLAAASRSQDLQLT
jgi:hypothetical protein